MLPKVQAASRLPACRHLPPGAREGPTARRPLEDRQGHDRSCCVRSRSLATPLPPRRVLRHGLHSRQAGGVLSRRQPSAPTSRSPSSVSRSRLNWQIPSQSCGTSTLRTHLPSSSSRIANGTPFPSVITCTDPGIGIGKSANSVPEDRRAVVVVVLINRIVGVETAAVVVWRRSPAEMGGKWSFASTHRGGGVAPIPARLEPHVAGVYSVTTDPFMCRVAPFSRKRSPACFAQLL